LILATKTHQASDQRVALFLDTDLSILGSEEKTYDKYARAIRQEYIWIPEELYRAARAKVLEGFLRRERIYQTAKFAGLEAPAKANLSRELQTLKSVPAR
jgi:predicted metal-dependent HD superfamily phosphohydrolase